MQSITSLENELASKKAVITKTVKTIKDNLKEQINKAKEIGKEKNVSEVKIDKKVKELTEESVKLIKDAKAEAGKEISRIQAYIDERNNDKPDTRNNNTSSETENKVPKNTVKSTETERVTSLLSEVESLENGEYVGLINKSLQSRSTEVVETLRSLCLKMQRKEDKLNEEGVCAKIITDRGVHLRTFSLKEHGEDYKELAKRFISNGKNVGATIEYQD